MDVDSMMDDIFESWRDCAAHEKSGAELAECYYNGAIEIEHELVSPSISRRRPNLTNSYSVVITTVDAATEADTAVIT